MRETAELASRVRALEDQVFEMTRELARLRGREAGEKPIVETPQEQAEIRLSDFVLDEVLISQVEFVRDDPIVKVVASDPLGPAVALAQSSAPRRLARLVRDRDPFDEAMRACKTMAVSAAVDQAPALPFDARK